MTRLDPKFVVSSRPANSRTTEKMAKLSQPINPLIQERLATIKARNRFGTTLTEQLRLSEFKSKKLPLSNWTVLGSILSAVSCVSLLLGWIQTSATLTFAGILGLTGGLGIVVFSRRANADSFQTAASKIALFDDNYLQAFDRLLDQLATEVPDEIAIHLTEIKRQIVRLAQLVATTNVDENFTMEDRMYLIESVHRYLPDSLQSYLMVPQNQRSTLMLEQGQTANALLLSQINILRAELGKQEMKLTRSSAYDLLKQQRFLESKAKS